MTRIYLIFLYLMCFFVSEAQNKANSTIDDNALNQGVYYYSILNNDDTGATAGQTNINLDFFQMMANTYGFVLGTYVIDPGSTQLKKLKGLSKSEKMEMLFPEDYTIIQKKAKNIGCHLEILDENREKTIEDLTQSYADVHTKSLGTTAHNRAGNIAKLSKKEFDNQIGLCFSSCMDYWDDELVMQIFNNSTNSPPRIYGNPWLLSDDELPKLARILNLYDEYKNILSRNKSLPKSYGINTVSKGDGKRRFIALSNMSWETKYITLKLDEEIGLTKEQVLELRTFHPQEKILGMHSYGQILDVELKPFRTYLFYIGTPIDYPFTFKNIAYEIQNNNKKELSVMLKQQPISSTRANLLFKERNSKYELNGAKLRGRSSLRSLRIETFRRPNYDPYYLYLGAFSTVKANPESEALYEATVYSTDNNAPEVRSLDRGNWSEINEVSAAQEAFFNQASFVAKEAWDRYLFDNNANTAFTVSHKINELDACLRIDLGEITEVDEIKLIVEKKMDLKPQQIGKEYSLEVSTDLVNWDIIKYTAALSSTIPINASLRYIRVAGAPNRIIEVEGYKDEVKLASDKWWASNLFPHAKDKEVVKMWQLDKKLTKIHKSAYLCVALDGVHGIEGAYVAAKINGHYIGFPRRSVSYPANTWQDSVLQSDKNYTYFLPLTEDMVREKIEIYVLAFDKENIKFKPKAYVVSRDPYKEALLKVTK